MLTFACEIIASSVRIPWTVSVNAFEGEPCNVFVMANLEEKVASEKVGPASVGVHIFIRAKLVQGLTFR